MALDYNTARAMKAAAIGTIMPYTGEIASIPKGWKSCNGDSIRCSDYPLLARVIRDTYGGTNVDFSDSNFIFPYIGYNSAFINLPNMNQRGVADIDYNYFGSNAPNAVIDTLEARAVVDDYIGTSSAPNSNLALIDNFQAETSVNFTLNTVSMTGVVDGQTLVGGIAQKTVYVMPRKLGRDHFPNHTHSTIIESINTNDQADPGLGPSIFGFETVQIDGVLFDFNSIYSDFTRNTEQSWDKPSNPFNEGPGRHILAGIDGGKLMRQYKPNTTQSSWHGIKTWFTDSLKQKGRTPDDTQINSSSKIWDGYINTGDPISFGDTNQLAETPNFDPGAGTLGGVSVPGSDNAHYRGALGGYPVLFNHGARSFTVNDPSSTPNNHIFAHQHEDFQVKFDLQSLRIDDSINVNVSTGGSDPLTPNNLPSAFSIDWKVQTASMSTLYLIRAF